MPLAARGAASSVLAEERSPAATVVRRFDQTTIAEFSCAEIHGLTCDELASVVRTAPPPTVPQMMLEHLEFQNREVLERLAFLARECCRKRASAAAG